MAEFYDEVRHNNTWPQQQAEAGTAAAPAHAFARTHTPHSVPRVTSQQQQDDGEDRLDTDKSQQQQDGVPRVTSQQQQDDGEDRLDTDKGPTEFDEPPSDDGF